MFDKREQVIGVEYIAVPYRITGEELFYTLETYDVYLLRAAAFCFDLCAKRIFRAPTGFDKKVEDGLSDLGIGVSTLRKLVCTFANNFDFVTRYWKYILKNTLPKAIVTVNGNSVGNMLMIFTANQMGIPTVELTHGLINRQHIGYIFKNVSRKERNSLKKACANYIITHGKLQSNILIEEGTFWDRDKIIDLGFAYLDYFINNVNVDEKEIRTRLNIGSQLNILVITSQEPLQALLRDMLFAVDVPDDWFVVVKLHPAEMVSWEKSYSSLLNKSRLGFVTDEDVSIYELLKISTAHASFYSNVLWEAAAFGLGNYIIDHSTKDMVSELEDLGLAKVSSIKDIFVDTFKPSRRFVNYVFSYLDGSSARRILAFLEGLDR
jgi:hypothetical protein